MTKKGGSHHTKRITLPHTLPVTGRKRIQWALTSRPGPHPKGQSVALGTLLRDVLHIGADSREVKRALTAGQIQVDGKVARDIRRPVGLMDIIQVPKMGKAWRLQVVDNRLGPKAIDVKAAGHKLCKVVGKKTLAPDSIMLTLHDGRTLKGDNNVKVGATLRVALPGIKMEKMLPLAPGAKCLVTKGKHAGETAILEKVIERVGSMDSEAQLKSGNESFVTVTKYLFAVDDEFA